MINKLDFSEPTILEKALNIQREAYEVEAKLISSRNIPPLHETLDDLRNAKESFFGYFMADELAGFIATENEEEDLRISRLVVAPKFFGNGIGTKLVSYVLASLRNGRQVLVSTANKNIPVKRLYEKIGFLQKRVFEIDGIYIAEFKYE